MTQEQALKILLSGSNVFLTGSAGTGKTYIINKYIKQLRKKRVKLAVTASTGIAATHINGRTIHSYTGIGIKDKLTDKDLTFMYGSDILLKNLEGLEVLIIDEISMLHKKQLGLVDKVLRYFNDALQPFGGVQIVVCGDFFQLPPVGKYGELSKDKFCFMGQAWVEARMTVCYLTKQYRQEGKNELSEILNEIRNNSVSKKSFNLLNSRRDFKSEKNRTKLYTHNADVNSENNKRLSEIKQKSKIFLASVSGKPKLIEILKKNVLTEEKTVLKVGARVMFVKNNPRKGYVNGTIGDIIKFDKAGMPVVKTIDGSEIIAEREKWEIQSHDGNPLATYKQIPLKLAWSITCHKIQGMTLDSAEIDLTNCFELGQGYVALSRLRHLKGLFLTGYNETALSVDKLALKADKRFMELSEENEVIEKEFEKQESKAVKEQKSIMP